MENQQNTVGVNKIEHPEYDSTSNKAIANRLARVEGHINLVKRMVEEGYDYGKILVQLAAVKAALNNAGKVIVKKHIDQCLVEVYEKGNTDAVQDLKDAITQFVK